MRRCPLRILGLILLLTAPGLAWAAGPRPASPSWSPRTIRRPSAPWGRPPCRSSPASTPAGTTKGRCGSPASSTNWAGALPRPSRSLLKDAHTTNPDLRIAVQYALGRVSDSEKVVDTLLEIMRNDGSPIFRDKAACALSYDQIHLTEAQKVRLYAGLIDALADPKPQVQVIAITSLKILTGQDKGFRRSDPPEKKQQSMEAWKRWLAEYRAESLVVTVLLLLAFDGAWATGAAAPPFLVRYSFDDGAVATGPDTFTVFRNAKGSVQLSTAFHVSGYRSLEIRDVAGDGDFPELQGFFPRAPGRPALPPLRPACHQSEPGAERRPGRPGLVWAVEGRHRPLAHRPRRLSPPRLEQHPEAPAGDQALHLVRRRRRL